MIVGLSFLFSSFPNSHHGANILLLYLQENCAVSRADDSGATALSSTASCKDLFGTQRIGTYSKIRSWKSVSSCGFFSLLKPQFALASPLQLTY